MKIEAWDPGRYFKICLEKFEFLINNYGFSIISNKADSNSANIIFTNAYTGIKITYDFRYYYIFVLFYNLSTGQNPVKPFAKGYSLDDVITVKNGSVNRNRSPKNIASYQDIEKVLDFHVSAMQQYAIDVLTGDFSIFPELEKIVCARATEYKLKSRYRHTKGSDLET